MDTSGIDMARAERRMSPEKQRIAIAEACGWLNPHCDRSLAEKLHTNPPSGWVGISPTTQTLDHGKDESKDYNYWTLPDYLNDLNAMHEAEKVLTPDLHGHYFAHLRRFTDAPHAEFFVVIHATAAQRAEAFLRTLGLWEEE